jgi:hypothetical protein
MNMKSDGLDRMAQVVNTRLEKQKKAEERIERGRESDGPSLPA